MGFQDTTVFVAPDGVFSQVRGHDTEPLTNDTIGQLLTNAVERWPHRPALIFCEQDVRWTWLEFDVEVNRFAQGLLALGLQRGDRLGIWSPNRSEWLVTQFATARIGVILVNINPAYRLTELEYALTTSSCRALVSAERLRSSSYLEMLQKLAPELQTAKPGKLRAARLPSLEIVIRMGDGDTPGMLSYEDVKSRGAASAPAAQLTVASAALDCMDAINIQFTSGTTGHPKGATLSHHNVVNNAKFIAQAMRFTESDSLCVPVPMYHCFGMVLSVLACVSSGAQLVFPGEIFDAGATLSAVSKERCTALHGVPTMFIAELEHPLFNTFDLTRLRTGIMAGSPCPIETMRRVVSEMHMKDVTIAYGMTETSPVSFQSSTADPLERRVSTVGRIQPHLEAKIVDASGDTVAIGDVGEIWVRGYSVMRGYWGDDERTRETIVDGWMKTGDLGSIDDEGYCSIVGRVKDMLIRGGENIYPREIEEFLFRHPKVQSAQVFGVPDSKYGEEICAWIVVKAGETLTDDEVRGFCKEQIAHFKVPRHIRFVEEMPMTITGKVQKFVMRTEMIAQLELAKPRTA